MATSGKTAETALKGGRIWLGQGLGWAEAIAMADGKVMASGSDADIEGLIGSDTKVIDLKGRLATPGLNDVHMHLLPYGTAMAEVDLRPSAAPSIAAVKTALADRAATMPKGEWVIGRGYDHFAFDEKRHPTCAELDEACPDHPVYIVRTDGHLAVANSRAFELAGITADTPSPEGGLIEKKDGKLTGLVAETGREKLMNVMPKKTADELVESIVRGGEDLLTYGITSCMEAAIGIRDGWTEMEAYQKCHAEGRMPVRVYGTLMGDKTRSILERCMDEGLVTGNGDEIFRIGPVKIFTDGSAGGRTAAMKRPYMGGGPDDTGLLCIPDQDELNAMVLEAHKAGYQFAIHAIGDAAIEEVLNAYEAAYEAHPVKDRRHRIEHCGWLTGDQMERMKKMHVLPVPQPSFLYYFGDLYLTLLEEERVAASHPMRDWLNAGLHPQASTDCPVTEIAPMPVIYNMVTRKTSKGTVIGEDQKLTMEEALHAYTWASAYATHEETIKGTLADGQLADIAVFDRNLFEIDPEEILETRCDMTILGGNLVYERA
ncbi:amidohydrolase [Roseovarius sp. SCSIO 43702]|uniref:amidohydrolase n=1 Tax=Roseovarius sp. SCSIO 43702 TaxID=2823043 RepID=UPI001C735DC1|nr:amidohydrolase [Roseovarius sp. SCSIO 43702]QYX57182.1 amidohydrolase [Roseovarius sp. SCSIO 43702]